MIDFGCFQISRFSFCSQIYLLPWLVASQSERNDQNFLIAVFILGQWHFEN